MNTLIMIVNTKIIASTNESKEAKQVISKPNWYVQLVCWLILPNIFISSILYCICFSYITIWIVHDHCFLCTTSFVMAVWLLLVFILLFSLLFCHWLITIHLRSHKLHTTGSSLNLLGRGGCWVVCCNSMSLLIVCVGSSLQLLLSYLFSLNYKTKMLLLVVQCFIPIIVVVITVFSLIHQHPYNNVVCWLLFISVFHLLLLP